MLIGMSLAISFQVAVDCSRERFNQASWAAPRNAES